MVPTAQCFGTLWLCLKTLHSRTRVIFFFIYYKVKGTRAQEDPVMGEETYSIGREAPNTGKKPAYVGTELRDQAVAI